MRILAIGKVGDKTRGDRPREHCTCITVIDKVLFRKEVRQKGTD